MDGPQVVLSGEDRTHLYQAPPQSYLLTGDGEPGNETELGVGRD